MNKDIKTSQKAIVDYGEVPNGIINGLDDQICIWIRVIPESDGEVNLQKCISEAITDFKSNNEPHRTIEFRETNRLELKKTDEVAIVGVSFRIKDWEC